MNEKEKVKVLRQMKKAAEKAEAWRIIEEQKKAEKAAKSGLVANVKAMATEAVATIKATNKAPAALYGIGGSGLDDTQISSTSPSRVLRKRDSSTIDISISRLSLAHGLVLPTDTIQLDRLDSFIFNGSLHSLLSHRIQYGSFPSRWNELQVFLEKVIYKIYSCIC